MYDTTKTLEALKKRESLMEDKLGDSSTAYAPSAMPSSSDISASAQLSSVRKQIEKIQSDQLRKRWYGKDSEEVEKPDQGLFFDALDALQMPASAVMGAGQYVLGKGDESNIIANMNKAMKDKLVAGDVLQQFGMENRLARAPLGFLLDVALDPVNWATMGTAALIPRIAGGLIKGGARGAGVKGALKAAQVGATSNLAKKAAITMKLAKFPVTAPVKLASKVVKPFSKTVGEKVAIVPTKYDSLASRISKKAVKGAEQYDELMGRTVFDTLGRTPLGFKSGMIGSAIERNIRKIPAMKFTPSGEKVVDFFEYSTRKAGEMAALKDREIRLMTERGMKPVRSESGAHFLLIDDALAPGATVNVKNKVNETITEVVYKADDGILRTESLAQIKVHDTLDNAKRLFAIAEEDYNLKQLERLYREIPRGKTGVRWYDNKIDKLKNTTLRNLKNKELGPVVLKSIEKNSENLIKNWNVNWDKTLDLKPFEKLLKGHDLFLAIFKPAKVVMNVSSHVVARGGNYFMGAMLGIPVWRKEYRQFIGSANRFLKGSMAPAEFRKIFIQDSSAFLELAINNPTRFKKFSGVDVSEVVDQIKRTMEPTTTTKKVLSSAEEFKKKKEQLQEVLTMSKEIFEGASEDILSVQNLKSWAQKGEEATKHMNKTELKSFMKQTERLKTPREQTMKLLKGAPLRSSEEMTGFVSADLSYNPIIDQFKDKIAKRALSTNAPIDKLLDAVINTMPRWYEHIDQTSKIGGFNFLTQFGLNEAELRIIGRTVRILQKDTLEPIVRNGEKFYRLTPVKASEVVLEAFMDYSAMPDFVRVMRALPIVGHPFMCRSFDTEILTLQGWKTYEELNIGESIFSFDIQTKKIVIKPVKNIHTFECNEPVNHIKSRSLDIIATDEHDLLIGKRERHELEKGKDGKRRRKEGDFKISRGKPRDLVSTSSHIVVSAENAFDCQTEKQYSDDWVELVGWYVTEGFMTYKKVDGSFSSFSISQGKPIGVERIRQLHKRFGSPGSIWVNKKEKYKKEYPKMNYDVHIFHFNAKVKQFIDTIAPKKQLTVDFILKLTKEQMQLLFDILVLADGHKDKNGRICFTQNPSITLDSFQVLCLLLGKSVHVIQNKIHDKCKTVLVSNKHYRQLKRNMPKKISYSGIVWCPEVTDTGTWIARRNGKIDITGNSFEYAMAAKVAKTAINNPAVFNKVGFMMDELNAGRSPEEKMAMEEKYNQYLNSSTVVKMFGIWNTDAKRMVPYLSMSMLDSSDRDYDDSIRGKVLKLVDKVPVFKNPGGQILLDYWIIPYILSGTGQVPQGMFGQPLFPAHDIKGEQIDVSAWTKTGYATRNLLESIVPGSVSYLGLLNFSNTLSPEVVNYLPLYGLRNLANATQGRSTMGAMTKENVMQKTIRSVFGRTGIPLYNLDTTKTLTR